HFWMFLQESCHGYGICALVLDAHAHGLHSPDQQERGAGIHRAPEVDDHVAHAVHPTTAAGGGTGNDVRMDAPAFSGAVNDHVEAHRDGFLQSGRGECVVND